MIESPQVAIPAGYFHLWIGNEMISGRVLPLLCLVDNILGPLDEFRRRSRATLAAVRLFLDTASSDGKYSLLLLVLEESLTLYPVFPNPVRYILRLRSRIPASSLVVMPTVNIFAMLLYGPNRSVYVFARFAFFSTVTH
jgi:hypothetical protein